MELTKKQLDTLVDGIEKLNQQAQDIKDLKQQAQDIKDLNHKMDSLRGDVKVIFKGIMDTVNRKDQTAFRQAQAGQFYQPTKKYADGTPSVNYFHPNSNSWKSNSVY